MTSLEPCSQCHRHVRTSEASCPFCGASLAATMRALPKRRLPRAGLSRAALLALGTGTLLPACDDPPEEANVVPVYGAPVPPTLDAGSTPDAGMREAGPATPVYSADAAIYGAPVPRPDAGPAFHPTDAAVHSIDSGAAVDGAAASESDARAADRGQPAAVYGAPPVSRTD